MESSSSGLAEVITLHRHDCTASHCVDDSQQQASRDRATAQALREHLQGVEAGPEWPVEAAAQVRDARIRAREVSHEAGIADDRRDALVLVASELVGNAVRHGRSPVHYDVHVDDDDLVLIVSDADPTAPGPGSCCDPTTESGRGLFLVGQLTRCWGWKPTRDGKQVWARL